MRASNESISLVWGRSSRRSKLREALERNVTQDRQVVLREKSRKENRKKKHAASVLQGAFRNAQMRRRSTAAIVIQRAVKQKIRPAVAKEIHEKKSKSSAISKRRKKSSVLKQKSPRESKSLPAVATPKKKASNAMRHPRPQSPRSDGRIRVGGGWVLEAEYSPRIVLRGKRELRIKKIKANEDDPEEGGKGPSQHLHRAALKGGRCAQLSTGLRSAKQRSRGQSKHERISSAPYRNVARRLAESVEDRTIRVSCAIFMPHRLLPLAVLALCHKRSASIGATRMLT